MELIDSSRQCTTPPTLPENLDPSVEKGHRLSPQACPSLSCSLEGMWAKEGITQRPGNSSILKWNQSVRGFQSTPSSTPCSIVLIIFSGPSSFQCRSTTSTGNYVENVLNSVELPHTKYTGISLLFHWRTFFKLLNQCFFDQTGDWMTAARQISNHHLKYIVALALFYCRIQWAFTRYLTRLQRPRL